MDKLIETVGVSHPVQKAHEHTPVVNYGSGFILALFALAVGAAIVGPSRRSSEESSRGHTNV